MRRNRVHLSLWGKLMAFIVAPVLLTVTVIQLVTLVSFRRLQIETAAESVRTQAFSIARSYKEMYGEVIQGINLITIDEELQDLIVRAEPDTEAWLNDNRALRSLIVEKTVLNEGIEAIYLYDQAGRMRTFWHRNYRLGSTVPLYPEMPTDWTLPSGRVTSRMDGEKLLAILLVMLFILPAGVLAEDTKTLDMFWFTDGVETESMKGLIAEYESITPGVKINLIEVPFEAMSKKIMMSVSGGEPPALVRTTEGITSNCADAYAGPGGAGPGRAAAD